MMSHTAFICTPNFFLPQPCTNLHAVLTSWSLTSFIVNLHLPTIWHPIPTLIESGATSNFIDSNLTFQAQLIYLSLQSPIALSLFDGKPTTSGFIHNYVETKIIFPKAFFQMISLLITKLHPSALIVLGLLWLHMTNPMIWEKLSLSFPLSTASMLLPMTVTMACTTISTPAIFDTIPELLHTAPMNTLSPANGSPLFPQSLGFIPNKVIGKHLIGLHTYHLNTK